MKTNTESKDSEKPHDDPKQSAEFIRVATELVAANSDGSDFMRAMQVVPSATGGLTQKKAAGTMDASGKKSGSNQS